MSETTGHNDAGTQCGPVIDFVAFLLVNANETSIERDQKALTRSLDRSLDGL